MRDRRDEISQSRVREMAFLAEQSKGSEGWDLVKGK